METFQVKRVVTPVASFSCVVPSVSESVRAPSIVSCATACITKRGCSYFTLEGTTCGLTDLFALSSLHPALNADVITNVTSWYTVD